MEKVPTAGKGINNQMVMMMMIVTKGIHNPMAMMVMIVKMAFCKQRYAPTCSLSWVISECALRALKSAF